MAQLIPLPLTVSCFSEIQIGFTFLVLAYLGNPGQNPESRKRLCVYMCVCNCVSVSTGVRDGTHSCDQQTKWQTYRPCYSICSNRLYLAPASTAMQPINIKRDNSLKFTWQIAIKTLCVHIFSRISAW